jgi:hypothetical protein
MKGRLFTWLVAALIVCGGSLRPVHAQSMTTLDPSTFASGQNVSNAFAGVTLSAMSLVPDGIDPRTGLSFYAPSYAPVYAAGNFFSPSSAGSSSYGDWGPGPQPPTENCIKGCDGLVGAQFQTMLLADFAKPVNMVDALQIDNSFNGALIQAFNSHDQLVGVCFPAIGTPQAVGNYGCYSVINNGDFEHYQLETSISASNISMILVGGYNSEDQIGKIEYETARAPEIDPASIASGLTLLFGSIGVLRGRRGAKQKTIA